MWKQTASDELRALAYSHDSRTLFTIEGNRVLAWDIKSKTSTELFQIANPQSVVTKADVTADGQYLVLTTQAGCVLWNVTKGERCPDFPRGWSWLAPAPTGCDIRFMGKNQTTIRVYDPIKGKERKFLDVARGLGKMSCWALSPDEKRLVLADTRGALLAQDLATGAAFTIAEPEPNRCKIDNVAFSPDGKAVVLLMRDGIEIWNAADFTVRVPRFPAPNAGWSFAFHPKGPYFAAPDAKKKLTLYNLDTGAVVREYKFQLGDWVRQIGFAPDGSSCAACGTNNQFGIFEVDPLPG